LVLDGEKGQITFSPCEKVYTLNDKPGLIKEIGLEAFMGLVKIGVTDLKKVVSENTVNALGSYSRGNTRTMKIALKAPV
jgi:hypothetical protein